MPDPTGQFEIEKVDDKDSELKLKGAVFQVLDKEGKEVSRLITDEKRSNFQPISNWKVYD
ncbi:hypothetical protein HFP67_28690 [Bacillus sp. CB102A.1]